MILCTNLKLDNAEMNPLNFTHHESAHLYARNSVLYSSISSVEVLNPVSMDAQEVLGQNSGGPLILKGTKVLPPQKLPFGILILS